MKICRIQVKLWIKKFSVVGHGKSLERNKRFRPVRETFIQIAWKQLDSLVLRVIPNEELQHTKKINNKDINVDYGATEDIPENTCSFMDDGGQQ